MAQDASESEIVRIEIIKSKETETKCKPFLTPSGFKFQLQVPSPLEIQDTTDCAELLLTGFDEISPTCAVDHVEINDVRFTPEAASGMMMFLATQASKVKHLKIHQVIPVLDTLYRSENGNHSPSNADEEALSCLSLAFQDSRLETLDLSQNVLGAYIWQQFQTQNRLLSLQLNSVCMDDASLIAWEQELASNNTCSGSLTKLSFSNMCQTVTERGVEAADNFLRRCTNLQYLRWASIPPSTPSSEARELLASSQHNEEKQRFPMRGLNILAQRMQRMQGQLQHLELEGLKLHESDLSGKFGLCKSLGLLDRMTHLSLKNVGLTGPKLKEILEAIKAGGLSLQTLDLSANRLGSDGAKILTRIGDSRNLASSLMVLNVENNDIPTMGAVDLLSGLAAKGLTDINILFDRNPLNMTKVAFALASSKRDIEVERDSLRDEHERMTRQIGVTDPEKVEKLTRDVVEKDKEIRTLRSSQVSMASQIQNLQLEVNKRTKDRDALIAAMSVLGAGKAVEDRNAILQRLDRLEEIVQVAPGTSGARLIPQVLRNENGTDSVADPETSDFIDEEEIIVDLAPIPLSPLDDSTRNSTRRNRSAVRQRLLNELESSQRSRTRTGEAFLSDASASSDYHPRNSPAVQPNNTLQEKLEAKLAAQGTDRVQVLEDIAKLRQKKRVEKRSLQGRNLLRSNSMHALQRALPSDTNRRKLLERSKSYLGSYHEDDIVGGPEVTLPSRSSASGTNFPGRPTLVRSARSFRNQTASSDRFQRLLHRQIQTQLLRDGQLNNDRSQMKRNSRQEVEQRYFNRRFRSKSESPAHSAHERNMSLHSFLSDETKSLEMPRSAHSRSIQKESFFVSTLDVSESMEDEDFEIDDDLEAKMIPRSSFENNRNGTSHKSRGLTTIPSPRMQVRKTNREDPKSHDVSKDESIDPYKVYNI